MPSRSLERKCPWCRVRLRAFTSSPFTPDQSVADFYDKARRMDELLTTSKYAAQNKLGMPLRDDWWKQNGNALIWYSANDGQKAKEMRQAIDGIRQTNEAMSRVKNSKLDPKEKTERMKGLNEARNAISRMALDAIAFPGR